MIHEKNIRVRYAETDKMGYVYHGNYAQYFEVGRVEFLRHIGFSYKELEDSGVMMPLVEMNIKFKRPAQYDDLLTIKSSITDINEKRMFFKQQVYNDKGKMLTEGNIELAFIHSDTKRPIACPEELYSIFSKLIDIDARKN